MKQLNALIAQVQALLLNILHFHFSAAFRLIASWVGFKGTYLVHAHVIGHDGNPLLCSFFYVCKPWITILHIDDVNRAAALRAGNETLQTRVILVAISKVGNQ